MISKIYTKVTLVLVGGNVSHLLLDGIAIETTDLQGYSNGMLALTQGIGTVVTVIGNLYNIPGLTLSKVSKDVDQITLTYYNKIVKISGLEISKNGDFKASILVDNIEYSQNKEVEV